DTIDAPIDNHTEPLQLQVTLLDYNDYVGRIGVGRVSRGKIAVGDRVVVMKQDGSRQSFRVTKLFGFLGLKRVEIKEAFAGGIITVSGMEKINIGESICKEDHPDALLMLHIDEPTLQKTFLVNDSQFAGKDGKNMTSS